MITVSAADFQKQFGRFRDLAQREPVTVTSHGRKSVVLLSADEDDRLKSLDRESFYVWELSDEDLEAIVQARPPAHTKQFNDEVES
jgi:prevent-host-death family protein